MGVIVILHYHGYVEPNAYFLVVIFEYNVISKSRGKISELTQNNATEQALKHIKVSLAVINIL